MRNSFSASSRRLAILAGAVLLAGCASYDGRGLQPGVSSADDVVALMGTPAMQWQDADGRRQLAYPRGPEGLQTFMAFIDTQGRLERVEKVLDTPHFARIEPGKSDQAAILRLLGPSQPQWTMYFERRDELVWEWRFCDDWGQVARFDVLFDGMSGIVRTSYQRAELGGPQLVVLAVDEPQRHPDAPERGQQIKHRQTAQRLGLGGERVAAGPDVRAGGAERRGEAAE